MEETLQVTLTWDEIDAALPGGVGTVPLLLESIAPMLGGGAVAGPILDAIKRACAERPPVTMALAVGPTSRVALVIR